MRPQALVVAALLLPSFPVQAEWDPLTVRVRDADTGASIPAVIDVALNGSRRAITATAYGYVPLSSYYEPSASLPITFWLPPLSRKPLEAPPPGMGIVTGHVYDEATGAPLEGAMVSLTEADERAIADAEGAFRIVYPAPGANGSGLPPMGRLVITAASHETLRIEGILLSHDVVSLIEDLAEGAGERVEDVTPLPLKGHAEQDLHQSASARGSDASPAALGPRSLAAPDLVGMVPPPSIRVGTSCSCTSCSGVSVYALEDYVARGLDNEWISGWAAHSLRAGAVPYRSYGAYYVYNPINGSYDICASTCCQAFGSTEYGSTQSAANLTAGFMLERGQPEPMRSEYSAENNALLGALSCVNGDLSCGDGWAGSPAAGWPCLSDSPCAGQDCFGHGRGECQWGTQRWAANQGQLWNWISNHYYNDNGGGSGMRTGYLTSPITMPAFSPTPSTVSPGDTFTINVTADNSAGLDHSEIVIGASLYAPGPGYIDDPANDTKVYLAVGSNNVSRPFTVPGSTPAGSYDLLVALYYDTDGDNAITGSDLALLLDTLPGGITVTTCGAIALSPASLPDGTVGVAYSQTISASGGTAPYSFAATSGALPPGLSLSSGGLLSGAPTAAGSYGFTVTATDAAACTGSQGYSIVVSPPSAPLHDVLAGEGLGQPNPNRVRIFQASGAATLVDLYAYAAGNWGVNVAAAGVKGAAREQILTGPGPGPAFGPQVRGFTRTGASMSKINYYAYGTLKYGVNVAGALLDADGYAEILTGAGPGPVFGPHVRGFNYDNAAITAMAKVSFFAYGTLKYGVNVTSGSVDADGYAEIVTGPGPGSVFGPQVRGFNFDGASVASIAKINFNAFTAAQYGANVAAGDVDGDGYAEIVCAPGPGAGASFRSHFLGFNFDGASIAALNLYDVTVGTTSYGGRVGLGDVTGDGRRDLLAGLGRDPAAPATVSMYDYTGFGMSAVATFNAFNGAAYGVNAAGGDLGF